MKLSVVIPVYNVEKYVSKCIFSVIENNMNTSDYEIIVVDDESPDNSIQIVSEISKTHDSIRIISQKNKGLGGARNTGIENAKGDYLLFLDSDDWYLPNSLSKIISISHENNLDVLEFGAHGVNQEKELVYKYEKSSNGQILNGIDYCANIQYMDSACNKLYRRDFLTENKLLFLERIYIEDYEFNTRVFFKAKKVMAIDFVVANFLQSPDSITRNISVEKQAKMQSDLISVIKKIDALRIEHNDNKFFQQRLGFLTATLFYQLIKNKAPFAKFLELKSILKKEKIYFVKYSIQDKKKNLFRILFLKNFFLLKLISK